MNPNLLKRSLEELLPEGENGASAAIQCDKCGRIEVYRPNTTADDIQTIEGFMDTKTYFADQGWQVSLGYDLCPDCAIAEKDTFDISPAYQLVTTAKVKSVSVELYKPSFEITDDTN